MNTLARVILTEQGLSDANELILFWKQLYGLEKAESYTADLWNKVDSLS